MKAMFLKELRENLKWGLLILGFFTLSVAGWIHEAGPNLLFDITRPETTGLPLSPPTEIGALATAVWLIEALLMLNSLSAEELAWKKSKLFQYAGGLHEPLMPLKASTIWLSLPLCQCPMLSRSTR